MQPTYNNSKFLDGRVAFITGGLTGQGLAIAKLLAYHGANIVAGSYSRENLRSQDDASHYPSQSEIAEVKNSLSGFGTQVIASHLDVRDQVQIDQIVARVIKQFGKIDILVNAAGITVEQGVCGHSDELWEKVIGANLTGSFKTIRACLPLMIANYWGRIINLGSTAASVGWAENPAYCASKAGLLGLTRCVALEGAPHKVSCVMISPTWVETELMRQNISQIAEKDESGKGADVIKQEIMVNNPQGRIIQPNEVASLVVHLCRDESLGITGENIQVTGGALW